MWLYCNLFYTNCYPLNHGEIWGNSREQFPNKAQMSKWTRRRKRKEGRGKKIPSSTVVNEEIHQEEQQPGPSQECKNLAESWNDGCNVEEEDGRSTCKNCKLPWIELMEKCKGWVQFDICDKYICPKCCDKIDLCAGKGFFWQHFHRILNKKVRFPFNSLLGCFIESLLISLHRGITISIFSVRTIKIKLWCYFFHVVSFHGNLP